MTSVAVYSYTHSVTYVTDNILKSLKDIIRLSGLDPSNFASQWESNQRAIKTWIESEHLKRVVLEIYNPENNSLILRWDVDIDYRWSVDDGNFWTDTDQLKYAIQKAGIAPQNAKYDIIAVTKPGEPSVFGWGSTSTRSTSGMVRQSLGGTVGHSGLAANTAYWR